MVLQLCVLSECESVLVGMRRRAASLYSTVHVMCWESAKEASKNFTAASGVSRQPMVSILIVELDFDVSQLK